MQSAIQGTAQGTSEISLNKVSVFLKHLVKNDALEAAIPFTSTGQKHHHKESYSYRTDSAICSGDI